MNDQRSFSHKHASNRGLLTHPIVIKVWDWVCRKTIWGFPIGELDDVRYCRGDIVRLYDSTCTISILWRFRASTQKTKIRKKKNIIDVGSTPNQMCHFTQKHHFTILRQQSTFPTPTLHRMLVVCFNKNCATWPQNQLPFCFWMQRQLTDLDGKWFQNNKKTSHTENDLTTAGVLVSHNMQSSLKLLCIRILCHKHLIFLTAQRVNENEFWVPSGMKNANSWDAPVLGKIVQLSSVSVTVCIESQSQTWHLCDVVQKVEGHQLSTFKSLAVLHVMGN